MLQEQNHKTEVAHEGQAFVMITINNNPFSIHRGRQTVAEIKRLGGVPQADVLEQLIDGKLTPLPDDGAVTIKGGEVFLSHVRDGGSAKIGESI